MSHRAYFDVHDSAMIRRALVRAQHGVDARPRVTITAREGLDLNDDGVVDEVSTASRTSALPLPSAVDTDVGDAGQPTGTDPCQYFSVPGPCVNEPGPVYAAQYYLDTEEIGFGCLSAGYPQPATYETLGYQRLAYTINTSSDDFSTYAYPTYGQNGQANGAVVSMTDRNFSDHPWHYQPVIACVPAS